MTKCPSCARSLPDGVHSCPACGAQLPTDSFVATQLISDAASPAPKKGDGAARVGDRAPSSSDSRDRGRFVAGTVLAERYRIISLVGRGGMGEVYQAEDLKLEQTVALKFLPESLSADGAALARLYREVRVARQISHRNVCRVYDIGETGGLHFLSMEFVPGEELASLLRRIGRLPHDKAVEVARQLCAGLAAAHEQGVLHRDLKPANVMIDDAGNVRVTDFGLAGLAEEFRGRDIASGTPAYMAPEQLAGKEVTIKSDLYALGLVVYEIFTGKQAFEARSVEELLRLRETTSTPTSPSSIVKDIDPLVERVIGRCLEVEPARRPSSALQVAAALPGGDPVAAALAAGETPSPETVAAAPKEGVLRPAVATALLASFAAMLALACLLSRDVALYRLVPLEKPPEVLRERAREIVRTHGYAERPLDSADGFNVQLNYLRHLIEHDRTPARWEVLGSGQPAAYYFWYRQSPRNIYAVGVVPVIFDFPPQDVPGMARVLLDTEGRLRYFDAVPPETETAQQQEAKPPDWAALFREAGFEQASFRAVAPARVPPRESDARAAWEGSLPTQPQFPVRVEAAGYRGRPVFFEVSYPWGGYFKGDEESASARDRALSFVVLAVILLALFGGVLLALRNLRLGRGDRRGASRLAVFLFALWMADWLFGARHTGAPLAEFNLLVEYLKSSLFGAAFLWVLYVALEPFLRRRNPERIISWSRLLAGGWRDPLVGRDALVGAVFGAGFLLSAYISNLAPKWLGAAPDIEIVPGIERLGAAHFVGAFVWQISGGLFQAFIFTFLLLLLSIVLRRAWLAAAAGWLVIAVADALTANELTPVSLVSSAITGLLLVAVTYRYGLLAAVSCLFVLHLFVFFPVTTDFGAWYAGGFVAALAACVALALYGFYTSLGGQPLFKRGLLEE